MAVGKNLPFVEYKISANKRQALKTTCKTHLVQRPNLSSMSFLCMQTNGFKVCTNRYILLQLNLCIYRHMKQSLLQVFFLKRCQHNANNMQSFGRTVKKKCVEQPTITSRIHSQGLVLYDQNSTQYSHYTGNNLQMPELTYLSKSHSKWCYIQTLNPNNYNHYISGL